MSVKVILEGQLDETVSNGEVLAATVDEGATVGNGMHVRITSVDKHRQHRALGLLSGQRVRVTVELIDAPPEVGEVTHLPVPAPTPAQQRWADLVDTVDRRRQLEAAIATA